MSAEPSEVDQVVVQTLRRAVEGLPSQEIADGICAGAADLVGVAAASLCADYGRGMSVPVGASNARALLAEQVQFTTGEGPCWQAYTTGAPVVYHRGARRSVEIAGPTMELDRNEEWPTYGAELHRRTGFTDAAALPLRAGVDLPLVLVLYDRADLAATVADWGPAIATAVPVVLKGSVAASGGDATWLDSSTTRLRALVWMAEEYLMAAAPGMDRDEAQEVLRHYATREMRTVDEVASDVDTGRLLVSALLIPGSMDPLGRRH